MELNIESVYPTFFYALLYVLTLVYLIKGKKQLYVIYIASVWTISAVTAVFFHSATTFLYKNVSVIPFIYLFSAFAISLWSISNHKRLTLYEPNDRLYKLLEKAMCFFIIISIVPFFENLSYVLTTTNSDNSTAIADMYDSKMYGGGYKVTWLSNIGMIFNSINGVFLAFIQFIPFVLLTRERLGKVFSILMFLPIATHLLFQIASSGRGTVVSFLITTVFLLILFKDKIPVQRMKKISFGFVASGGFLLFAMLIISYARKEATNANTDDSIFFGYYIAKSHLDFNENIWSLSVFTEGDNTISFIKDILGLDTFTDFLKKEAYWEPRIGIPAGYFYTFVGDFVMDFGIYIAGLILFVCPLLLKRYFNKNRDFVTLFWFFVYSRMILMGWTICNIKTYGAFKNLIISFILVLIISKYAGDNCLKNNKRQVY